jgi:pantoate--beta-alanine ligase
VEIYDDIPSLREYVAGHKRLGKRIVLVPTMGALHDGHGACVAVGREVPGAILVVSIFVNRTQFAPGEDLAAYPRTLEADLEACRQWGVDAVYAPSDDEMYPSPQRTWVEVEELTEPLCGGTRPGHFRGVTTVVTKLFNIVQPDIAVFGQKDGQQALVIREMVRQLSVPIELRLAATAREPDGLAKSSRNSYLSPDERRRAASIYGALELARERVVSGERSAAAVVEAVAGHMLDGGVDEVEYAELLDARDLCPLDEIAGKIILAVAVKIGKTRLIDNVVWNVGADGTVSEEMLF